MNKSGFSDSSSCGSGKPPCATGWISKFTTPRTCWHQDHGVLYGAVHSPHMESSLQEYHCKELCYRVQPHSWQNCQLPTSGGRNIKRELKRQRLQRTTKGTILPLKSDEPHGYHRTARKEMTSFFGWGGPGLGSWRTPVIRLCS